MYVNVGYFLQKLIDTNVQRVNTPAASLHLRALNLDHEVYGKSSLTLQPLLG